MLVYTGIYYDLRLIVPAEDFINSRTKKTVNSVILLYEDK